MCNETDKYCLLYLRKVALFSFILKPYIVVFKWFQSLKRRGGNKIVFAESVDIYAGKCYYQIGDYQIFRLNPCSDTMKGISSN